MRIKCKNQSGGAFQDVVDGVYNENRRDYCVLTTTFRGELCTFLNG